MASRTILVIGGGAAGFFGAITCAEANTDTQVLLLEASQQWLAKVRISGGGRCNVTHACFDPVTLTQHYPRGGKALRGGFSRFQPRDTIQWFARHGVALHTEADGRMFPVTNDSETIVNCLVQTAKTAGVMIRTGCPVTTVVRSPDRSELPFEVRLKSGEVLRSDRLLLATGSSPQGYRLATSLGHHIEPPVPSLFTFMIADPQLRELAGVAVEAQAQLLIANGKPLTQTGAILITHWGLSGPAILKLSAWGARALYDCRYQATLRINWLPSQSPEQIRQLLLSQKTDSGKRTIAAHAPVTLPRRLWQYLVQRADINEGDRWAELSKAAMNRLIQELTQGGFRVQGKGVFKDEFVTCGGVALKEVDFKTMQSRCCPGLYFAGEVLDIDGITGGFNFQSAWTTGWIAGQAMAHQ